MSIVRRILRLVSWPVRRLFDPRFADVNRRIGATKQSLHEESILTRHALTERTGDLEGSLVSFASANTESITFVGTQLRAFDQDLREVGDRLAQVETRLDHGYERLFDNMGTVALEHRVDELIADGGELDGAMARLLNFAQSHQGFAARDKLWLNPPVSLHYREGGVAVGDVNERIVEVPYAFRALHGIDPGARILDVGSAESTVSLSLAAMGYQAIALDLHPYPFAHPNLTVVQSRLETWEPDPHGFDAILCISTIEHVGLGWYGEEPEPPGADRRALERLGRWLKPEGLLIVTVPYGVASVDDVQRTYDEATLSVLLDGWRIEDRTIVTREERAVWTLGANAVGDRAVAMVTARPPQPG